MPNIEFGVHFTERRIQAAAESVNDSFLYRAFDIDERWNERVEIFPEFAVVIDKIKEIIRRRQERFTPQNFEEQGRRHLDISHFVHEKTGVPHLFPTEVILNRAFGKNIPNELDDASKTRIEQVASDVVVESGGLALKSDNKSATDFIGKVLKGEIGIDYELPLGQPVPGQIEFDLI